MDANTTWGPPRLATLAAAVLHRSLVADLKAIQAAQKAQPATAGPTAAADVSQQLEVQPAAVVRPAAASISPAQQSISSGSSNTGTNRRRWGRHRRANSDAARWAGRLYEISPRPSSNGSRRLSTGALGRSSRRGRVGSPGMGPSVVPPSSDRMNLQEALGQLSPRALVAALVGSNAEDASGNSSIVAAAALAGPDASPSAGSSWMRLVTRQVRLGGTRQQQQQQAACTSPEPEDCCPQQQQCQAGDEAAQATGDQKAAGCSLLRSASDSFCLVLGDVEQHDWQKLAEGGLLVGIEGDKQQADQQDGKDHDGIPAVFDSGKVSPFPELKSDMPGGCWLEFVCKCNC